MKKLQYTIYTFAPFDMYSCPQSEVISRHKTIGQAQKAVNKYHGEKCVDRKEYEGEQIGGNVDSYLRSL